MRDLEKPAIGNMIALLHDQPFVVSHDLIRNIRTLTRRFSNEGFSFLSKVLPTLGKAIDASLSGNVTFCLPTAFKRYRKTCIPHFLGSALRRVFDINGQLLQNPCVTTIQWLRTFCFHCYKIEVPFDEELTKTFESSFVATDTEIGNFPFVGCDDTRRIRNLMRAQLDHLHCGHSTPVFGPGISSNCRRNEKYNQFVPPSNLRNAFGRSFFHQPDEYWLVELSLTWLSSYCLAFLGLDINDPVEFFPSKILFVPKDSRGPRVICCEDSRLMYAQKSLQKSLYSQIESSPVFGTYVNFTDQTINQKATFDTGNATLDLKDASDRISLDLVIDVFPQNLVTKMLSCRSSRYLLPSGDIGEMQKFAPMGSALCFPVMALIAYTAVTSAIYLAGGPSPRSNRSVLVYGDDIVVPNEWAHVAVSALEIVGLKVNLQKSFINSRFRESCGQDTFDQSTVTPVRAKKNLAKPKKEKYSGKWVLVDTDGSISSNVSVMNSSRRAGYHNLANYLEKELTKLIRLPYGTSESPYLCIEVDRSLVSAYNKAEGFEVNGKLRAVVVRDKREHLMFASNAYGRLRRNLLEGGGRIPSVSIDEFGVLPASTFDPLKIGARSTFLQQKTFQKWGSSYS